MSATALKILEQAAAQHPDISGVIFEKYKPVKSLLLSKLISRARYAATVPAHKRSTNDLMDMAAWNLTWRCFKRSRPALAELIQDDFVKEIVRVFDATISIDL